MTCQPLSVEGVSTSWEAGTSITTEPMQSFPAPCTPSFVHVTLPQRLNYFWFSFLANIGIMCDKSVLKLWKTQCDCKHSTKILYYHYYHRLERVPMNGAHPTEEGGCFVVCNHASSSRILLSKKHLWFAAHRLKDAAVV